jgi:hypothetical protein
VRIATLKRIVKNGQYEKIDGVLVDALTAHALLMCWEAGNDNTKEMIATGDIRAVGKVALRVCKKA